MAIPVRALPQALANALGRVLDQVEQACPSNDDEHLTQYYQDLAVREEWDLSRR